MRLFTNCRLFLRLVDDGPNVCHYMQHMYCRWASKKRSQLICSGQLAYQYEEDWSRSRLGSNGLAQGTWFTSKSTIKAVTWLSLVFLLDYQRQWDLSYCHCSYYLQRLRRAEYWCCILNSSLCHFSSFSGDQSKSLLNFAAFSCTPGLSLFRLVIWSCLFA
jgi:hypothetical protein